tara:strand:+ start:225 stop:842 length:618 start_codon:yes stop_codon:yes gene_type:complete
LTRRLLLTAALITVVSCATEEATDSFPSDYGAHPLHVNYSIEDIQAFSLDDSFVMGHLSDAQLINAISIMEASTDKTFDIATLLAIAFRESAFKTDLISKQGDVGAFQINARWWWKKLGYASRAAFIKANQDVTTSTRNAIEILKKFKKFKSCRGDNLFACYNGGPGWRLSKNVEKIKAYQKRVIRARYLIKRHMKRWKRDIKSE